MENTIWYCLNTTVYKINNFRIGKGNAIQKKFIYLHQIDEQIKSSLLLTLLQYVYSYSCFPFLQSSFLFQLKKKIMNTYVIILHMFFFTTGNIQ